MKVLEGGYKPMKQVKVTFFKESGKYYCQEVGYIHTDLLSGTNEYWLALRSLHRIKEMDMLVNQFDDNVEPYIVPHLFKGDY